MPRPVPNAELRRRRAAARRRVRLQRLVVAVALLALVTGAVVAAAHPRRRTAPRTAVGRPVMASAGSRVAMRHGADAAAVARVLRRTPYLAGGAPRRREVALTFDDGPGPATPELLRYLTHHHVRATFFVVGRTLADPGARRLLRQEVRDGFALGDHTQSHAFLTRLDALGQAAEIDSDARAIRAVSGSSPDLFRPPYGAFDTSTLALLHQRRMLMVLWSIDSEDFQRPGSARIASNVLGAAHAGSVVLMHDGGGDRSQTLAALPAIVRGLRHRGYRLVTVPTLLRDDPPPSRQPPPRSLAGHL